MYDKGRTYYWKHILFPVILKKNSMSTTQRVLSCLAVGIILEVIWALLFGNLSATPMVIGISICALVTQKDRKERNE